MKTILPLLLLAFSLNSLAASVKVAPFDIEFTMDSENYEADFQLEMACRYEKLTFGNSSKYSYSYEMVPLQITHEGASVTVSNTKERGLTLDGFMKSGKECQTYLRFFFKDKRYALGRGAQFNRPVRLGLFEHSDLEEDKIFDVEKLRELIEGREISFIYAPVGGRFNVRLAIDGVPAPGMSSYLFGSAALNEDTGLPFLLNE